MSLSQRRPPRRAAAGFRYCICHTCGWRGGRRETANTRPCPSCRGKVYLPHGKPGMQPAAVERIRFSVWLPQPWVDALRLDEIGAGARVRRLVAQHLKIDHDRYMAAKRKGR